ncbi:MAG: fasciclin domain-containing protein [Cyclobacteriaceae bacterium]
MKLTKLLSMALVFMLFASACQEEEVIQAPVDQDEKSLLQTLQDFNLELDYNIYSGDDDLNARRRGKGPKVKEKVRKVPSFRILIAALKKTKLLSTVISNKVTLFAPTDDAFKALLKAQGITAEQLLASEQLDEILLYHVVPGFVFSDDLNEGSVETLNGAEVEVSFEDDHIFINASKVIRADVKAANTVIHIIDQVLLPPTEDDDDGMEEGMTIAEIASADPDNFSILVAALDKAGLVDALNGTTEYTVFAPTNAAFAKLGIDEAADLPDVEELTRILLYHVLQGETTSDELKSIFYPTLNGAAVEVDLSAGVVIKGVGNTPDHLPSVIIPDVQATNGVIHVIDNVLVPPSANIVEVASNVDAFSTLVLAVQTAGLVDALAEGGPFTVFAPTNEAFGLFLEEFGLTAEALLAEENRELLTAVLKYHVVEGRVFSTDLEDGLEVKTLQGEDIEFELDEDEALIEDEADREIPLNTQMLNIQATNGVIHVINNVLFPFDGDDD